MRVNAKTRYRSGSGSGSRSRSRNQGRSSAYAHVYGEVVYAECLHSFGTTAARAEPHCVKCGEPYVNPTSGLWDEEEK